MASRGKNYDQTPKPPYARKGRKERFAVILAAEDVEAYTHIKSRDKDIWPARERGGLPVRMIHEAEDAYGFLVEANDLDLRIPWERGERLSLQRKALTRLKLLNHHIEFVHSEPRHWISDSVFKYWTDLVEECRKRAAGWYTSDRDRAVKIEKAERDADINRLAKVLDEMRGDRIAPRYSR